MFYFELETLRNKLVKLCSYFFFQKNNFEQKCSGFILSKKSFYYLAGPTNERKELFINLKNSSSNKARVQLYLHNMLSLSMTK